MKIFRFQGEKGACYGVLRVGAVYPLLNEPNGQWPFGSETPGAVELDETRKFEPDRVTLLPPVLPSKVVAVGINYRDHAEEFGHEIPDEPVLFMKPSTAVIGPGQDIVLPRSSARVDYEAEIAAVVKRRACRVEPDEAPDYILGYTCLNDVTARDLQRRDGQWTRSKSFDTFCPIGPYIETDLDPNNVNIVSRLNGETRQSSNTRNFIVPLFDLFSYVTHIMTLLPGDIVTTGTPSGVGPMKPGDVIEIEVEGIGILRNRVASPPKG
jgi:2-keto-4-pentenoate hydratase/2-oxohepta-3-ene-1,7-dioic acid hydratase in catechol pathway